VARTFRENLDQFVHDEEENHSARRAVAERLLSLPDAVSLAPFDALYPYADLFLSACLTVAVADGTYSVEDARRISAYAHRLGMSARQLADLEHRVFADLRERGASKLARDQAAQEEEALGEAETMFDDRTDSGLPSSDDLTEDASRPSG
jgi:hypothetical protein